MVGCGVLCVCTRRLGVPVFTVVPVTVDFDEVGLPAIEHPYDSDFADWIVSRRDGRQTHLLVVEQAQHGSED